MRYAVSIPQFTDARVVVDLAVDAERAGWDGVFLWDHLQWSAELRPPVHDPWVLLGAIAVQTERVRLGAMVTPLSRRRPVVVAKHVTTLDHLSGGRAVVGVGLGEPPVADFTAFGDEPDAKVRGAMLDEGLVVLDGLLRGGPFEHRGEHYVVDGADLRPGPVTRPRPPIWVAGSPPNRRPLRRALRYDGFVPIGRDGFLDPDQLAAYVASGGDRPDGWDVVASRAPGVPARAYEGGVATWLMDSTWPVDDWVPELRERIRRGPGGYD